MKLLVINGSPRGERGSSAMILSAFEKGVKTDASLEVRSVTLSREKNKETLLEPFAKADAAILAFPLYADAMPAMVMELIAQLQPLKGACANKPFGFIVQSGFPEACQSRAVERYNEKLCRRLGCAYLGTAIKGNCNRLERQPKFMAKRILDGFEQLGRGFARTRTFDPSVVSKLAKPERLGRATLALFRVLDTLTPLTRHDWNKQLKANNALKERDARPYARLG